ncbi:hypothetical protein ACUSIJ_12280 [Pseudochelatococcus sp. B33]
MAEEIEQVGDIASASIPPYIPFQTLLTFLKQMKTDGLPPQIDKSVLTKFSGGTQNQLKVALKALGLMDDNKPTDDMATLVDAFETSEFEPTLRRLLERTYPYVFKIDLMTATPTMFADAFKVTGAREDVSRKCRTFFLHAAKQAGVPLGNRLLTGSVPRNSGNGTRKRRKAQTEVSNVTPAPAAVAQQTITEKALEYRLVDLMSEAASDPETLAAIIKVITFLKTREAKQDMGANHS